MSAIEKIRAKLLAQETKSSGNNAKGNFDTTVYPHWNIDENTTARIRFLPDADPKNPLFWVERNLINLEFAGIKGQPESKPVVVQVPCVDMWTPNTCPIMAELRPWYKSEDLKELANKYWKKRSYFFQGFVRDNPIKDDESTAATIRRFIINPQIYNIIKSALLDPEFKNSPSDYNKGLDFRITKTTRGKYADYGTSNWARSESSLSTEELEAIEQQGLYNLADFLPKKPTDTDLKVMIEMFEASVDGQPYDADRWGTYYRPKGLQIDTNSSSSASSSNYSSADRVVSSEHVDTATNEDDDVPFDTTNNSRVADEYEAPAPTAPVATPASGGTQRAEDILAMIRNRQQKS